MEQISSVISLTPLDTKMHRLKNKTEDLESIKEDIKEELTHVESSSLKPRNAVKHWLEKVESTSNKVRRLEQDVQQSSSRLLRPRLEMDVDNHTREVVELIEEGRFPNGLTIEAHEPLQLVTKELLGEAFERNKNMILDCLNHGDSPIIGVYGMGGVGKTTLLTNVHNELISNRVNVSWVTVSQNSSIAKLQYDIGKRLNLDISCEDDKRIRAAKLASALNRKKNCIFILDDVWEPISLDELGICAGSNGHKLIITTRSLEVCRMMNCRKSIFVQPLNREEAWKLFVKTLQNDNQLSHRIEDIAKSLVEECDGLPLGVATMAGSMRGVDDIHEWSNALEEIKEAKYRNGDMEFFHVFHVLKHSYDKLKSPLQECLLYCSLFPEDELIERDQLIEHFIDEKFIDGMNSRQSQISKGHTILNKLENVCLLEGETELNGTRYVKMHDLVRDMALKIASTRFFVQARMTLEDIPESKKWSEDLVRVSLMENYISHIPFNASPRCPRLSTLLLNENSLRIIPDDFFMHMKMLTVLDLSFNSIESLPTSISNLESLTALLLCSCECLCYVPSLENLITLRRLDLSNTRIREVPRGLEKLVDLRYLNLYGCLELKWIPDGILSELSNIEYFFSDLLSLHGTEIANWGKLETFLGTFDHIDDLKMCVKSWEQREPNNYTIVVGCRYDQYNPDGNLIVSGKKVHLFDIDYVEDAPVLPTCMQFLSLDCCRSITSLSHIAKLCKALSVCNIGDCYDMRYVICSCCNIAFSQSLESLKIWGLHKLTDLIERQMSLSSISSVLQIKIFSSLKELYVGNCDRLKILFMQAQLSHLKNLERLEVHRCKQLVEIIGESDDQEATTTIIFTLPRLRYLKLGLLHQLKSFCSCSIKISNSLEEIEIRHCEKLTRLTLLWEEPYPPPSLKSIKVEKSWWDSSLVWKHPETKVVLQPFVKYSDQLSEEPYDNWLILPERSEWNY